MEIDATEGRQKGRVMGMGEAIKLLSIERKEGWNELQYKLEDQRKSGEMPDKWGVLLERIDSREET